MRSYVIVIEDAKVVAVVVVVDAVAVVAVVADAVVAVVADAVVLTADAVVDDGAVAAAVFCYCYC